ncbi:MAG: hypothetical protein HUJ71_09490, partial [Pseudobutyrivibrio sp.]|nr:hypothetical protein [Pseudobutyrivibrio sp.]
MEKRKRPETSGKTKKKRSDAVTYRVTREDAVGILQGLLITAVISLLFFRSIYGAVSGVLILPFWLRQYRNELHQKRRADMENEFKEYTMMIASLLDAGYSLERALRQSEV